MGRAGFDPAAHATHAIEQGRAADAQTYVQSLIDAAEADRWIAHHRGTAKATLDVS